MAELTRATSSLCCESAIRAIRVITFLNVGGDLREPRGYAVLEDRESAPKEEAC